MAATNPRYIKQPGGGGGSSLPSGATPGDVLVFVGPDDDDLVWSSVVAVYATIGCVFDGAGDVLEVGRFVDVPVPYDCTIIENEILVNPSGGLSIEIWRETYAGFPPTVADKITAASPIVVSGAEKNKDTVLTGWTTTLLAGDILRFIITGATSVTKATVFLKVMK